MNSFAALLVRRSTDWSAREISVDHCESVEDIADLARDEAGDVRLLVIEQDDEYAAIVRVDEPRRRGPRASSPTGTPQTPTPSPRQSPRTLSRSATPTRPRTTASSPTPR